MEDIPRKLDYDGRWKEIIIALFEDFIAFFLPQAYPLIDFDVPAEFLEQELHQIIGDGLKEGKVVNDKLVKVHLNDGTEKWILIHIEVQSSYENDFNKRMFTYFYRIFDTYDQEITAIAIYTGLQVPKKYDKYEYSYLGTEAYYKYNTYRVIDVDEETLKKSVNPFSIAVLATKYLYQTKNKHQERYQFKLALIELARARKYTNKQILNLLKFVHLLLVLPASWEQKFVTTIIDKFSNHSTMQNLKSYYFSDQMHLTLYGESFQDRLARENKKSEEKIIALDAQIVKIKAENEAEVARIEAEKEAEKKLNITNLLKETNLSIETIAKTFTVSPEFVQAIKEEIYTEEN